MNLNNCYVETKDKEAVELFLDECESQGVRWVNGLSPRGFSYGRAGIVVLGNSLYRTSKTDEEQAKIGRTKLTASDFKKGNSFVDEFAKNLDGLFDVVDKVAGENGKEKQMQEYKYELVTDLDSNGIAKAMIDGEVFYSENGDCEFSWNGKNFVDGLGDYIDIDGSFYRRIKRNWYDKLDGTIENAVWCRVWDGHDEDKMVRPILTLNSDSWFVDDYGTSWQNAEPLTKSELAPLLANAPK